MESKGNPKRVRSSNYTPYEKQVIVGLIEKYSHILENKKTDGVSIKEKDMAWQQICLSYNTELNVAKRSVKQLRSFYENIKRQVKKAHANEKLERLKTGGGPAGPTMDDTSTKVLAIIQPQIEPLANHFDCDAEYNGELQNSAIHQSEENIDGDNEGDISDVQYTVIQQVDEDIGGNDLGLLNETLEVVESVTNEYPSTSCAGNPTSSSKKRRITDSARCRRNIAEMASQGVRLSEIEIEFMVKKFKKETELLEMKKENERLIRERLEIEKNNSLLHQEILKEQLFQLQQKRNV